MTLDTTTKIKKLEREVRELWQIVEDEIFWHPTVIHEIRRRSRNSHKNIKKLKNTKEAFKSLVAA